MDQHVKSTKTQRKWTKNTLGEDAMSKLYTRGNKFKSKY